MATDKRKIQGVISDTAAAFHRITDTIYKKLCNLVFFYLLSLSGKDSQLLQGF